MGVGVGQDVVDVAYVTPSGVEQRLTDAHNLWLNIAGQAGLLGVAALLGLCAWLLRAAWRPAMQGNAVVAAFAIAFVAAFLYQGMAGSFEDARHLWVLMGLLATPREPYTARVGRVGPTYMTQPYFRDSRATSSSACFGDL